MSIYKKGALVVKSGFCDNPHLLYAKCITDNRDSIGHRLYFLKEMRYDISRGAIYIIVFMKDY